MYKNMGFLLNIKHQTDESVAAPDSLLCSLHDYVATSVSDQGHQSHEL